MVKNRAWFARVIVSVTICVIVIRYIDWDNVVSTLKGANAYWILMGFLVIHLDRVFMSYKWSMLLRGSAVSAPTTALIKSYYIGSFWAPFLPSSVGGDVIRGTWLVRGGESGSIIFPSIVVERVLGGLASALVALGTSGVLIMYLELELARLSVVIGAFLTMSVIAVIVLFSHITYDWLDKLVSKWRRPGLRGLIEKMKVAILEFRDKPRLLTAFLILSILEQAFPIIANYMWARALSIDVPLVWLIIGMPIILAVSRVPISISSIGIQEGAYAYIFSLAGVEPSGSVLMALTGRVVGLLAALPGAFWTVSYSRKDELSVPLTHVKP